MPNYSIETKKNKKKKKKNSKRKKKKRKMMHNEPSIQTLPPPLPLSYEQETKSNGFLDFNPTHHQSIDPNDSSQQQQYSNFLQHNPTYHHPHLTSDEQFYSTTRNSFSSYPYPYSLPPYPTLAIDSGWL